MERIAHSTGSRRKDLFEMVGRHLPRHSARAMAARLGNFISEEPGWEDDGFEQDLAPESNLSGTPIAE